MDEWMMDEWMNIEGENGPLRKENDFLRAECQSPDWYMLCCLCSQLSGLRMN
jgi:hypothetical protein